MMCAGVEAVPMLYAPGDGVSNPPPADAKYLLLLNECDRPDQCNTSPEAAAVAWREWEAQYPAARLVGPNTSRAGWEWLLAWHAAYLRLYGEPPRIWALGIHCYNSAAWCQDWTTAHLALAREWTTSGQVWVTEWATTGCYYSEPKPADVDEALDEAEDLQAWFDAQPGVGRTAWFVLRLDSAACQTALDRAGRHGDSLRRLASRRQRRVAYHDENTDSAAAGKDQNLLGAGARQHRSASGR